MKESLHYLLMADHLLFQKSLLAGIKDTGLTLGQPKHKAVSYWHISVYCYELALKGRVRYVPSL